MQQFFCEYIPRFKVAWCGKWPCVRNTVCQCTSSWFMPVSKTIFTTKKVNNNGFYYLFSYYPTPALYLSPIDCFILLWLPLKPISPAQTCELLAVSANDIRVFAWPAVRRWLCPWGFVEVGSDTHMWHPAFEQPKNADFWICYCLLCIATSCTLYSLAPCQQRKRKMKARVQRFTIPMRIFVWKFITLQ